MITYDSSIINPWIEAVQLPQVIETNFLLLLLSEETVSNILTEPWHSHIDTAYLVTRQPEI